MVRNGKFLLKFIYSEKAPKFCEISTLLLSYVVPVKSKVEISQNFAAFSEYMNFNEKIIGVEYISRQISSPFSVFGTKHTTAVILLLNVSIQTRNWQDHFFGSAVFWLVSSAEKNYQKLWGDHFDTVDWVILNLWWKIGSNCVFKWIKFKKTGSNLHLFACAMIWNKSWNKPIIVSFFW